MHNWIFFNKQSWRERKELYDSCKTKVRGLFKQDEKRQVYVKRGEISDCYIWVRLSVICGGVCEKCTTVLIWVSEG